MQKFIKYKIIYVLAGLFLLPGCQRDDICPESTDTTPLLIIRFYDNNSPEKPKAPLDLSINELNNDTLLAHRISQDSIAIPLRTNVDITQYELTINAPELGENEDGDEADQTNTDLLSFTYATDEIYINRACAFKVNFIDLKLALNAREDGPWIENFIIEETTIEDETNAHISIYH